MPDTIKEQAMAALATVIAGASLVKVVNRDPRFPPGVGSTPAVNLYETSDPYSEFGSDAPTGKVYRVAQVLVQCIITGKTDGPTRLNNLVGNVIDAVKADHKLGGVVRDVRFSNVRNFVSHDQVMLMAEVDCEILYQHALADMSSL